VRPTFAAESTTSPLLAVIDSKAFNYCWRLCLIKACGIQTGAAATTGIKDKECEVMEWLDLELDGIGPK
jgi:hypothetical protein